jgi:chromosomal replication initiator protein
LSAFASLSKRPITVDFAREVLHDLLKERATVSVEDVQRVVCERYGLRLSDLLSKKRSRDVAFPRQIAMYLSRKLGGGSFPVIGEKFGGRDHTTVMHALRVIEARLRNDPSLRGTVEELERLANAKS